jgi:hypothetical protein
VSQRRVLFGLMLLALPVVLYLASIHPTPG